jgi:hypothetical protein
MLSVLTTEIIRKWCSRKHVEETRKSWKTVLETIHKIGIFDIAIDSSKLGLTDHTSVAVINIYLFLEQGKWNHFDWNSNGRGILMPMMGHTIGTIERLLIGSQRKRWIPCIRESASFHLIHTRVSDFLFAPDGCFWDWVLYPSIMALRWCGIASGMSLSLLLCPLRIRGETGQLQVCKETCQGSRTRIADELRCTEICPTDSTNTFLRNMEICLITRWAQRFLFKLKRRQIDEEMGKKGYRKVMCEQRWI